ncbi:MAG TPA: glycosyltransferase family 2 protein [Clostridia bacterium]|nr:glycosyltransferase family 2 protein [Clostridia bacterium]
MTFETLCLIALGLAAVPCVLFLVNLLVYRPTERFDGGVSAQSQTDPGSRLTPLSVLIPARNEAENIRATLEAVLANRGVDFEAVVLDDHSTDTTASIVAEMAKRDPRLRLESAPALPPGWCGKQHACYVLAGLARHSLMVFVDADVRLQPGALIRLSKFMAKSKADLASGVPRQEMITFSERLLLPLIHFVLLAFLPMHWARRSRSAAFAAGCGQLFIARKDAYFKAGGHAVIRDSLHDGIKLPRAFRKAGCRTELFDATDLASCRMYRTNSEVWRGLGKNATEGLAAPGTIGPMTLLLLGGQVLPLVLVGIAAASGRSGLAIALLALVCVFIPRLVAVYRFHQPLGSALLHPLGVLALLQIQWAALFRSLRGRPSQWKGRAYGPIRPELARGHSSTVLLALFVAMSTLATSAAESPAAQTLPNFVLPDQFEHQHACEFAADTLTVLIVADRKGSEQIRDWVKALKPHYGDRVRIEGVADVSSVPGPLQSLVRRRMKDKFTHPVMLDWQGTVTHHLRLTKGVANVFLIGGSGRVLKSVAGPADASNLQTMSDAINGRGKASSTKSKFRASG